MRKRDGWPLLLLGLGGVVLLASAGTASASTLAPPDPRRRSPRIPETDNRTALGRVIHSEAGTQTMAERVAIAWVARNNAARRGMSIAQLVCAPCGPQAGFPRPFSSRQPARETDLVVADAVLAAPASDDPTSGATNAFEPDAKDKAFAAGATKENADAIRVRWTGAYALERYGRVGRWELYGPRRG